MASKLKQSSAIRRQVPEYIREQYPALIDFLKAYYDFLEDTQSRSLEQYKDIDTTLEEFIELFKSELAKNVPLDMIDDKRNFIKRLRDFYLSRGSEASYKFLFRALFDKEASLFYPSTQILRASDGKWQQDVSIFVKVSGTTTDLFPLDDSFITIITPLKNIRTYVERVRKYDSDVYELFIQREFAQFVTEDSTIEAEIEGTTYTADVLLCPSRIKIINPGSGFAVGQRFNLETSLGKGCLIKVTRVNSTGGIISAQIIEFGLDYASMFWSYLSNKSVQALPYVSPATINSALSPPYSEYTGGTTESGFLAKQDYMIRDSNLTIPTSKSSDAYFVDSTYVGDIVAQFYQDQSKSPIDNSMAVIQVDVGYVARYPGYYLTQDGFVSDEMYIQDGKYYQTFSYVVKVEEEFRKYVDVVKSLVHPAGMRVYGDYNLVNALDLQASPVFVSSRRQFTSSFQMIDGGFAEGNFSTTPILTVSKSLSTSFFPESSPSKSFTKSSSSQFGVTSNASKTVGKNLTSLLSSPLSTITGRQVAKGINSLFTPVSNNSTRQFTKRLTSSAIPSSTSFRLFTKRPTSIVTLNDSSIFISVSRIVNITDQINTVSQLIRQLTKRPTSSQVVNTTSVGRSFTSNRSSNILPTQTGAAFVNAYINEDYFLFSDGYQTAAAILN
jgi:hypothetical protein